MQDHILVAEENDMFIDKKYDRRSSIEGAGAVPGLKRVTSNPMSPTMQSVSALEKAINKEIDKMAKSLLTFFFVFICKINIYI